MRLALTLIFAQSAVAPSGWLALSGRWLGTDRMLSLPFDPAPPSLVDLPRDARVNLEATLELPESGRIQGELVWRDVKVVSVEAMASPEVWFSPAEQERLGRTVEMSGVYDSWWEGDRSNEHEVHGWVQQEGECTDLNWPTPGYDDWGRWIRLRGTIEAHEHGGKYVRVLERLDVFPRFMVPTDALPRIR